MRSRKSAIDSRIIPAIGNELLVQTGIATLTKVVDHCVAKGTVNGRTLEGTISTLKMVAQWAADRSYLAQDVFGHEERIARVVKHGKTLISGRRQVSKSDSIGKFVNVCPTWDDVVTLAEAAGCVALERTSEEAWAERARAAVRVSAGTGLRMCELLGLQVSDVDMQSGIIKLWRQLDRYKAVSPVHHYAPLKHRSGMDSEEFRSVIVWAKVKDDLQYLINEADDDGCLFPAPECAHWLADWWGKVLTEARVQSGFKWSPHWLRHHYGSYSIATKREGGLGMSIARVQVSMGHMSPEVTTRTYLHPTAEGLSGWVE
jgi:hypothetical protein